MNDFLTGPGVYEAAHAYRRALPPGELLAFPITDLDRTGIPTWKAVFFPSDGSATIHNGHSYGPTSAQAILGALGELSETVHAHAALATLERRRASYVELARSVGAAGAIHPFRLGLPAGSEVTADTQLDWVTGSRYQNGEPVWLPIDVVAVGAQDMPGYRPFTTPLTNGLGAGPTRDFALAHGLQELLQRDGNGLRFRALDAGVALDLASLADPLVTDLLQRFAHAGIEPLVKFASDEFGIANVYAVGAEPAGVAAPLPIMVTAAGEAASPDRAVAVRKALLEFGAARPRKAFAHGPLETAARVAPAQYLERVLPRLTRHATAAEEPRALSAMLRWLELDQAQLRATIADPVLRITSTKPASALPVWQPVQATAEPGRELCATLAQRLSSAGLEIFYVDFSSPHMRALGVHVVKAIVPGLEVETLSYYRIGERNARSLLASESSLAVRRERPGCRRVRLLPEAEARLGGPVYLDVAAAERLVGALYPLYREPDVHVAPLARTALAS